MKDEKDEKDETRCKKWIYILVGVMIFLLAIFFIYYVSKGGNVTEYKSNTPKLNSTSQHFGFRFY